MEIGDTGKSFVWTTEATGTARYELPYSPVHGASLAVFVGSTDVSDDVECEEHTGFITFDNAPTSGLQITAQGTYFRFFTDAELTVIIDSAVREHLFNRTDAFGRAMTIDNLPVVEEYPAALLATVQALYTLATDASFDIDISTPDGIAIPRSERYRQLMDMIRARKEQYDQLCQALNIGLTRIDVFTFRRISRMTNRYVPVYMPQEVDDRRMPKRIRLPIPTYGGTVDVPSEVPQYDISMYQGDSFSVDLDFDFDLTGKTIKAQARQYPGAPSVSGEFTVTVTSASTGEVTLSMTSEQTKKMPEMSYWDLQVLVDGEQRTFLAGQVFTKREITQ